MGNNLLAVHAANHTRAHTAELSSSTGIMRVAGTVNARMEYFSLAGASCQKVVEASQNLLDEEQIKGAANWTEAAGGMADIVLALAPDTQYTLSRADTTGLGKGVLFVIKSSTVTDLASTSVIQSTVASLNKQARTITTGTDGCLTLSISRGADLQATLDDLWSWIGYLMLNTGDTALDHQPYRPASPSPENPSPVKSLEEFDIIVHSRNLFAPFFTAATTEAVDGVECYKFKTAYNRDIPPTFFRAGTYTVSCRIKRVYGTAGESERQYWGWDLATKDQSYPKAACKASLTGVKSSAGWQTVRTKIVVQEDFVAERIHEYSYDVAANGYYYIEKSSLALFYGDTIPPYVPYYRQVVPVPFALRAIGDGKDQLAVDQKAKKVTVTRLIDPEKIDPTKSIYDNPEQYLFETPIIEDITDTATGQALLQLATCYPETIIEIQCANELTGLMTAQMKKLGRERIYNCIILNQGDFLVDSEGEVLEWR